MAIEIKCDECGRELWDGKVYGEGCYNKIKEKLEKMEDTLLAQEEEIERLKAYIEELENDYEIPRS